MADAVDLITLTCFTHTTDVWVRRRTDKTFRSTYHVVPQPLTRSGHKFLYKIVTFVSKQEEGVLRPQVDGWTWEKTPSEK